MAELKRGIVQAFNSTDYRATVQVAGSLLGWLEGVAVARNIIAAEMVVGRNCALLIFDLSNPDDVVVVAVWG
jgi:hypothetical protein